jgi:hypothetical protein
MNKGKAKFVIKPFRPDVTWDRNRAVATWNALKHAISEIHHQNASALSFEELYRNAYNLVLHKHGELLYNVSVSLCIYCFVFGYTLKKWLPKEQALCRNVRRVASRSTAHTLGCVGVGGGGGVTPAHRALDSRRNAFPAHQTV